MINGSIYDGLKTTPPCAGCRAERTKVQEGGRRFKAKKKHWQIAGQLPAQKSEL
ncbi:hypothetical protein NEUTE1DRAFT_42109 [Neurospora tetrasperma FGSC 2508]|uniref:Uncharacterized protein n=1 Tax=Neurospora tetrasperma (strain FGSC 2508 / ATCC MYA-4615 / P0657) TaxID=510951 RepID=F8MLC9_NEUT8|nr:uncharacterized protein NEUTE1DRAFT_42109 [Neurospora tetrasperma FGSC 2508]EGO58402.1 hypothetical protein NEUTE1DRAFT_42109 [Neurospora tetrasperma FGSC 2508]EGZ71265.1 hypothetical protein NEUTE2DRAFT_64025 [Neurospora tetrasperma FGSC 2509]